MKRHFAILIALLVMTAAGFAQIPSLGNVFFGYSYNRADTGSNNRGNLNGWEGSVEGKFLPFVGIVGDVSAQYGTLQIPDVVSSSTRIQSYLVGPRVSFPIGKFRPFAHILIGASHLHETSGGVLPSNSETDFADAVGGGIDYHLIPRVAWRVQVDDLQTRFRGDRQDDTRISTGPVVHF